MTPPFPYTFYSCPCSEDQQSFPPNDDGDALDDAEGERTFNPHGPKSAYSLHTLDNLLFCDDCNQIRCAQCISEEVLHYYCPNCLFEVPSGMAKNDGNRCSRNCYACPLCTSPLTIMLLEPRDDGASKADNGVEEGTYILSCQYCSWTSLDIGVQFDKPTKITKQLQDAHKAASDSVANSSVRDTAPEEKFQKLTAFYKEQLMVSGEVTSSVNGASGSPANLKRIINLYGGLSHIALKKTQEKPEPMRELLPEEGLMMYDSQTPEEDHLVLKMSELGWFGTASAVQRQSAPINFDTRMVQDLWPAPIPLKTKRGKRCRQCKQYVLRPEQKISVSRYRLRIVAINHIPRLSLRSLDNTRPVINRSFFLKHEQPPEQPLLQPHVAQQFVLTLRNPIFETVKVTLATSATTPGRVASKVTILCPSFTIGPAGDVWDDALSAPMSGQSDGSRMAAMASLTGNNETDRQPEAGKVWEQTRNSTSVVLEIVPGALSSSPSIVPKAIRNEEDPIEEGDDVLEVPVYVRVEWTAELTADGEHKGTTERIAKELAYWCVLGVGRIAS